MQPPYPPGAPYENQPPPQKKGMSTCLIIFLVVGAISIPVLGIMAALGIYGVRRYLASAKTAEARNTINAIAKDAVSAYESEPLTGKTSGHRLCGSATPVPHDVPKGVKYTPSGADFKTGDATNGWTCLKFSMGSPMYYQYAYELGAGSGKSGATAAGFEVRAKGDLNGDGVTSLFARGADVRNGAIVLAPDLYIENEFE